MKNGKVSNSRKIKTWLAVALGIVVFVLVVINFQRVTVNMLFWTPRIPLVLLIVFSFAAGALVGYVVRRKR